MSNELTYCSAYGDLESYINTLYWVADRSENAVVDWTKLIYKGLYTLDEDDYDGTN